MEPELRNNESASRYEILVDDNVAGYIEYSRDDRVVDLPHTKVDDAYQGQGLAAKLADFALEDIRTSGLLVKPTCPYIAKHIEQNPDFETIVVAD